MLVRAHILPADYLEKGDFRLDVEGREAELTESLAHWISENKGLVPVLPAAHDTNQDAVGYVVDAEHGPEGIYVYARIDDPELKSSIAAGRWRRVSARLMQGTKDRKGETWPLRIQHLALVHEPQFHDQDPIQVVDLSADRALILEGDLSVVSATPNPGTVMEKNVAELETPAAAADAASEDKEKEDYEAANVSLKMETVLEKLEAVLSRLEDLATAPAAEEEEETPSEEDLSAANARLKAQVQVLRDVRGKELGAWKEDELVDLAASCEPAYRKVVAQLSTPKAASTVELGAPSSKVLGADLSAPSPEPVPEAEAIVKAQEAFEKGEDFLATYTRLTGGATH